MTETELLFGYPKTTYTCSCCKKEKHINSWVLLTMREGSGEEEEFKELFGGLKVRVCFCCYVKRTLNLNNKANNDQEKTS